jgi:putative peptide zinc metalloprotease protein
LLHLEPDEFALLALLDGSRTTSQVADAAGSDVAELLDDLWDEGYLVGSPHPKLRSVAVTLHGIEFAGFNKVMRGVYRVVGGAVFCRAGAVLLAKLAAAGLAAFGSQVSAGDRITVSTATPILAVVALRMLAFADVFLHESGHALVIVHNNRRVGMVGVGFYWGALTFYVDASDALFLPRRTRMLQSAAGILTDLVVCGAASLVALVGAGASWAVVLREFAVLGYIGAILNAVPLLELDGYWFMADTLDRPTLGRDSRAALRHILTRRPANWRLAVYGAASMVFGLIMLGVGLGTWWALFGHLFRTLWEGGVGYEILAAYLILPYLAMVGHLAAQPFRFLRQRRNRQLQPS